MTAFRISRAEIDQIVQDYTANPSRAVDTYGRMWLESPDLAMMVFELAGGNKNALVMALLMYELMEKRAFGPEG
jgi:hypothetical protein